MIYYIDNYTMYPGEKPEYNITIKCNDDEIKELKNALDKLKYKADPCPYCGKIPRKQSESNSTNHYVVCCNRECYLYEFKRPYDSLEEAVSAWNDFCRRVRKK